MFHPGTDGIFPCATRHLLENSVQMRVLLFASSPHQLLQDLSVSAISSSRSGIICGINHINSLIHCPHLVCEPQHMTHVNCKKNCKNCKPVRTITASGSGVQPKLLCPQQTLQQWLFSSALVFTHGIGLGQAALHE